ncbi:enoyl-CoA hydratase, partial [Xanthomonas sp. Kuri4-3]
RDAVTAVWVETALALGEKSLRTMDRLVKAQSRRATRGVA